MWTWSKTDPAVWAPRPDRSSQHQTSARWFPWFVNYAAESSENGILSESCRCKMGLMLYFIIVSPTQSNPNVLCESFGCDDTPNLKYSPWGCVHHRQDTLTSDQRTPTAGSLSNELPLWWHYHPPTTSPITNKPFYSSNLSLINLIRTC